MSRTFQNLLKLLFAAGLLLLIVTFVDIERTFEVMKEISPLFFSLAVLFAMFDQVILGFKWHILLRVFGVDVKRRVPILAYMRGKAFEIAAPSSLGIDTFKVYQVSKNAPAPADKVMSSVVVERFFGALSSFVVIGVMLWFSLQPFDMAFKLELSILGVIGSLSIIWLTGYMIAVSRRVESFSAWSKLPKKIGDLVTKVISNLHAINSSSAAVYKYLALSCIEKFSYGIVICLSAMAVGGIEGVDYLFILAATPFMALLERLPISFAAIGVRESFFMLLFASFTSDTAAILAVALTVRACEAVMILLLSLTWIGKFSDWKSVEPSTP